MNEKKEKSGSCKFIVWKEILTVLRVTGYGKRRSGKSHSMI